MATRREHVFTLRIDPKMSDELELLAMAVKLPISALIREAIADYLARRREDSAFQMALRARIERMQELLADDPDGRLVRCPAGGKDARCTKWINHSGNHSYVRDDRDYDD